ncbi:unnamed protein product [Cyprideis torosa]|uniref:Uncharacterized protein n=1 Tax=Cyprideis torosa TaxID=163714 RepID=A0A7R8WQV1_9CRUS|nr:unnamed protein product [Cyprideis torosa]CAG0906414.1 unnamed protein product [Cyprideis torosa]
MKDKKEDKTYHFREEVISRTVALATSATGKVQDLASKETRERREDLNVPQCVAKTPKPPIEQMMSDYRKRKELQQEVSEKRRRND